MDSESSPSDWETDSDPEPRMEPSYPSTSELRSYDEEQINNAGFTFLNRLLAKAGVQDDPYLESMGDMRERLVLMRRKLLGTSHSKMKLFSAVQSNNTSKIKPLADFFDSVQDIMNDVPVEPLSQVLRMEEFLEQNDILEELKARKEALQQEETKIVVLGETNGGKTSLLNLLLGEDLLPTAFTHCTIAICKIKYSPTYRIEVSEAGGKHTTHECDDVDQARALLQSLVAEDDVETRVKTSASKDVTVYMPAEILQKTGVTLVDTPGIGETPELDAITLNHVSSTQASGFIYVIKTDNAGGVQEDRLMSFLSAIREQYNTKSNLKETFDPGAAMFICHRWDTIRPENRDKMKDNAYRKLKSVWPGFEPSQTFFFSTADTKKHLPVDPSFITDSFYDLLKGLKTLFDTATNNAIRSQYIWLTNIIHPTARHLRTMITSCINNNEDLENTFREVATKQERLLSDSKEQVARLMDELEGFVSELTTAITGMFDLQNQDVVFCLPNYQELLEECSAERFLSDKSNRHALDEKLVDSILLYVDEEVRGRNLIQDIEAKVLEAIEKHLGLFKTQILEIRRVLRRGGRKVSTASLNRGSSLDSEGKEKIAHDLKEIASDVGREKAGTSTVTHASNEEAKKSSNALYKRTESMASLSSNDGRCSVSEFDLSGSQTSYASSISSDYLDDAESNMLPYTADPAELSIHVKSLLQNRRTMNKKSAQRNNQMEKRKTVIGVLKDLVMGKKPEPVSYLQERCVKIGLDIIKHKVVIDEIVAGYASWIIECGEYATASIPKFAAVNTRLMDEIRNHRELLSQDKDKMRQAMAKFEPCRKRLIGYGSLFMAEVQAEKLNFTLEHKHSSVRIPTDWSVSARGPNHRDSGFIGSGSNKGKVRKIGSSYWASLQTATIQVNNEPCRVIVKSYRNELNEQDLFSEIAILRCLDHKNIAPFFGMTRLKAGDNSTQANAENNTAKINGFIFKGDLVSMAVYSNRRAVVQREWLPKMFDSLLQGLNFIHKEKLVHMELNAHTVMVDKSDGNVKLCHFGLPRKARLPKQKDDMIKALICLSPDVLRGAVYEQKDDLYAFGLLLWEYIFPSDKPYAAESKMSLQEFIKTCNPAKMLGRQMENLHASPMILRVLKGTILPDEEANTRLSVSDIRRHLFDLKDDPSVQALPSRKHATGIHKRDSSGSKNGSIASPRYSSKGVVFKPAHRESISRDDSALQTAPQRPPRRKDFIKQTPALSTNESPKGFSEADTRRRASCPVLTIPSNLTTEKSASQKLKSKFARLFRRNKDKHIGVDSESESSSGSDKEKGRRFTLFKAKGDRMKIRRASETPPSTIGQIVLPVSSASVIPEQSTSKTSKPTELRLGSSVDNQATKLRLGSTVDNQATKLRLGSSLDNQPTKLRLGNSVDNLAQPSSPLFNRARMMSPANTGRTRRVSMPVLCQSFSQEHIEQEAKKILREEYGSSITSKNSIDNTVTRRNFNRREPDALSLDSHQSWPREIQRTARKDNTLKKSDKKYRAPTPPNWRQSADAVLMIKLEQADSDDGGYSTRKVSRNADSLSSSKRSHDEDFILGAMGLGTSTKSTLSLPNWEEPARSLSSSKRSTSETRRQRKNEVFYSSHAQFVHEAQLGGSFYLGSSSKLKSLGESIKSLVSSTAAIAEETNLANSSKKDSEGAIADGSDEQFNNYWDSDYGLLSEENKNANFVEDAAPPPPPIDLNMFSFDEEEESQEEEGNARNVLSDHDSHGSTEA